MTLRAQSFLCASCGAAIADVEAEARAAARSGNERVAAAQYGQLQQYRNGLGERVLEIEDKLELPPSYKTNPPPPKSCWW